MALEKDGRPKLHYPGVVRSDDGTHLVVEAPWPLDEARDLGFARLEPGDVWTEHYWRDRWYSVKEIRAADGTFKGWYCDVARPVRVEGDVVVSDDLDLDLWVSADGATILRLDEEEFAARDLERVDPEAAAEARKALDALDRLARNRFSGLLR